MYERPCRRSRCQGAPRGEGPCRRMKPAMLSSMMSIVALGAEGGYRCSGSGRVSLLWERKAGIVALGGVSLLWGTGIVALGAEGRTDIVALGAEAEVVAEELVLVG